jgi:hypothetical protein
MVNQWPIRRKRKKGKEERIDQRKMKPSILEAEGRKPTCNI